MSAPPAVGKAIFESLGHLNAQRYADAERIIRRVARNNPREADAQHILAVTLHNLRKTTAGLPYIERAVRLNPKSAQYHQNHGLMLQALGRNEEARAAFENATDRDVENPECWHNWGTSLMACERWDDAELALKHAIGLRGNYALSHFNLGCVYLTRGEVREAARRFDIALSCDSGFAKAHANLIFCRDLLPETTPKMALAERRAYQTRFASLYKPWPPHDNDRDPDRRLRVGYIGGDFRDHSAAYSFGPIIEGHDRDAVEVYVYADEPYVDDGTRRLRAAAQEWRRIPEWDDEDVAALIRQDRIDVLVELSGYTHRHHLLACARKPAPVIVTAWGYLTGTGLDAVDAIFADDVTIPPEHEAYYSERVVRLPHALVFSPPEFDVPIVRRPDDAPVTFGYPGRIAKISDATVALWSEILAGIPDSRLLFKDRGFSHEKARTRILGLFAAQGVAPERIEIRGTTNREKHLAAYNDVDVALDPIPQGGGVTTLEAMWMGTPTVTLLGDRVPGRMSASHLVRTASAYGLARDRDQYVKLAHGVVLGRVKRQSAEGIRRRLLASVIADAPTQTRAVEEAYRMLWKDWLRGR